MRNRWRVALVALAMGGCGTPEPPGGRRLELEDCRLEAPGLTARVAARCGTLTVPADRESLDGDRLTLRVAVVSAVSRTPAPDPLVFLTGGPGQAATESFVQIERAFERINRDRDIVLVDQRGTGSSSPLRCPKPDDDASLWLLDDDAMSDWVRDCLEALAPDPRLFTTSAAVEDLDAVREALGYERVNLYGASYGTRVALEYLRRHEERVRSVILDGVAPPTEILGMDVARDAQRAFDHLAERCAADPSCRDAFPDVRADLETVMTRLEQPEAVTLRHPSGGEEETMYLHRSTAAATIRFATYSLERSAIVPVMLRSAVAGDLKPLAAQYLMLSEQLESSLADAMGFSVICSEDFPFFEASAVAAAHEDTYLGAVQTEGLETVCPLWPVRPPPDDFKQPVRSDVPVLLLSGEADPVTPPDNAEIVAADLPNGRHVIAPEQGHVVIHRGCIPRIAASFVDAASPADLDVACVDELRPWPFFVSFAGPEP